MLSLINTSSFSAILWCLFLGVLYVGTLYIWRSDSSLARNHPKQVKNRFISVSIATVLSLVLLRLVMCKKDLTIREGFVDIVGLRIYGGALLLCFMGLFHVATLFLGPLFLRYLDNEWVFEMENDYAFAYRNLFEALKSHIHSLYWWRALVVGPVSEEIVFRACMCPVLYQAGFSKLKICFLAPLFFGVAHLHHFFELKKTYPAKKAAISVLFQFCYTYLFGIYACYLFVKTKCIYASIITHTFCNYMGFPDLDALTSHKHKNLLWVAHVGGIIGFYFLFRVI